MDNFIKVVTIALTLAYLGFAIWFIWKRETIGGSIGAAAASLFGGLLIAPIAEAIATFICWVIVAAIVMAVIGAGSG